MGIERVSLAEITRPPISPALLAQAEDIEPGACYPVLADGTISKRRCASDDTLGIVTFIGKDYIDFIKSE